MVYKVTTFNRLICFLLLFSQWLFEPAKTAWALQLEMPLEIFVFSKKKHNRNIENTKWKS